jgi:hypothetical protein
MRKFTSLQLSRADFLSWVGGEGELGPGSALDTAKLFKGDGAITLLWDRAKAERRGQPIVVVPRAEFRDFFAFVGTYASSYRPYSAFFRVVSAENVSILEQSVQLDGNPLRRVGRLLSGSILSELYLNSGRRWNDGPAQLASASATLSASLGQAVAAGYAGASFEWIAKEWFMLHNQGRTVPASSIQPEHLLPVWRLVSAATIGDRSDATDLLSVGAEQAIARFIADALRRRRVDREALSRLAEHVPPGIDLARTLLAPREERIRVFNEFASNLSEVPAGRDVSCFLAGLLLAISGNGSFDFLQSGGDLLSRSPASLIWFGVCVALFEESNVLTFSGNLGRRIVRDLDRPKSLFDPPDADLSSYEYKALRRDSYLEHVGSRDPGRLLIELLPNVLTSIPRDGDGDKDVDSVDVDVLADSLRQMRYILDRTQRMLTMKSSNRQRDLLRPETKPRSRR